MYHINSYTFYPKLLSTRRLSVAYSIYIVAQLGIRPTGHQPKRELDQMIIRRSGNQTKWLLDQMKMDEVYLDQVRISPSGYQTNWLLDQVGKDQLTIDELVLDQMKIRRTDIRPSAIRPSGKKIIRTTGNQTKWEVDEVIISPSGHQTK